MPGGPTELPNIYGAQDPLGEADASIPGCSFNLSKEWSLDTSSASPVCMVVGAVVSDRDPTSVWTWTGAMVLSAVTPKTGIRSDRPGDAR